MEENETIENGQVASSEDKKFKGYAAKRIMVGILLTVVGLWVFGTVIGFFDKSSMHGTAKAPAHSAEKTLAATASESAAHKAAPAKAHTTPAAAYEHLDEKSTGTESPAATAAHAPAESHTATAAHTPAKTHAAPTAQAQAKSHTAPATHATGTTTDHGTATDHGAPFGGVPQANGVAFVAATIAPMANELDERFYGWRPNDILDFTDNVNNFQLGVLEVTRRTAVSLAERISRTGSTDAFDPNLENAMNWFMIKATRYWFPSPESKYSAGLEELTTYMENLKIGQATFHNRTDNIIPLLSAFEDLLGSCDENLVKFKEEDGSDVSFFKADNYFFYAKGVASAMHTILEAVGHDFQDVVNTRRGGELLHHAVVSLHHATEIDPWVITNAGLSGVLANHRANMAAPISHARFYIGALIKTLST